ncbi:F-box domain [Dillenia turbinata]|uniref:F-box domain n=1 Tax=Dillenia turbinata TaxID=194707 RepID=A0AAN8Z9K1_9MAGN
MAERLMLPTLPEEIILEILYRLPVKSLLRFRSVSKRWLFLISNPDFIHSHLKHSQMQLDRLRILVSVFDGNDIKSSSMPLSIEKVAAMEKLNFPYISETIQIKLMGSCNGLLCLIDRYTEADIYMWNPCTSDCKKLPRLEYLTEKYHPNCGFGYDPSNDDYKVVLNSTESEDVMSVCVFSLKSNSWRVFSEEYYGLLDDYLYPGIYLNGSLHWRGFSRDCEHVFKIVYFDLVKEEFGEFPLPIKHTGLLGAIGGCLCVCARSVGSLVEVFVMKEYGVKESWSKMFNVYGGISHDLTYLHYTMDGDILLLVDNEELGIHSLEKSKWSILSVSNVEVQAAMYVESLVSPNKRDQATAESIAKLQLIKSPRLSFLQQIHNYKALPKHMVGQSRLESFYLADLAECRFLPLSEELWQCPQGLQAWRKLKVIDFNGFSAVLIRASDGDRIAKLMKAREEQMMKAISVVFPAFDIAGSGRAFRECVTVKECYILQQGIYEVCLRDDHYMNPYDFKAEIASFSFAVEAMMSFALWTFLARFGNSRWIDGGWRVLHSGQWKGSVQKT